MRAVSPRLLLFALLSALLQALPFPLAGPVPLWRRAFAWLCLVPLLLALRDLPKSARRLSWLPAAGVGYTCGVAWYLLNCYWIEPTMHRYGGLPVAVSVGILILFSLYLGMYHALFAVLFATVHRRLGWRTALALAPFLWVAVELARTNITGFPWDLLGYTQIDHLGLTRLAPIAGVMGLSLLVAGFNALWLMPSAYLASRPQRLGAIAGIALVGALLVSSPTWVAAPVSRGDRLAVLLQDNLHVGADPDQSGPVDASPSAMLASFVFLSEHPAQRAPDVRPASATVILWPEAPADFFDNDPTFRAVLTSLSSATRATVIAEDVAPAPADPDGTRHVYNSARMARPDGSEGGRYDKTHLVPFGEYTPYKPLFFFAGHLLDDLPFVPGLTKHALSSEGHRYGTFICYESIFGDEVRRLTLDGAQVLVNLSDDGWYGDSSAPWEHLDMARMRAIENNRWLLRSTNTGVTAAIDPQGRIAAQLPRHVRSSLLTPFAFRDGLTVYARFGDWIGWLCAAISALALGAGFLRRRPVH